MNDRHAVKAGSPGALEWAAQWKLVLASMAGFSFMSFMIPSAGLFMEPVGREFHWSRTQLSLGIALSAVISLFASPILGILLDKFGSRRIALFGIPATSCAIAAFSLANGSVGQWIALWLIWGVVALFVQSTVWSAAVASMFDASRGLAMGVTLSGAALATTIAPPLSNALIENVGWRMAYVWLGFGWGSIAFILCLLFLFDARDRSRLAPASAGPRPSLTGLTIREALRSSALWRVAIATFLIMTITVAISVHQFPILMETGITRTDAAWLAGLVGIAGIAGKLVTGALLDHMHARWVGGITLSSTAIAYPLLLDGISMPVLIVFAIMISGYAAGTKIQLCGYLTARYGGMKHYGALFGGITSMIALASGLGPFLAGLTFDLTGSYGVLLIGGAVVSLISGALIFSLGDYPIFSDQPDEPQG